jgi:hypothetical protein
MGFIGKSVSGEKSHCNVVPANGVEATVWEGGERGRQCSYGERSSVVEEILTGVMSRQSRTLT